MPDDTRTSYQERLNRVLDHMERHLDEELPLEELAAVACFSPYHFHRIFSGMVGEGVSAHLRRLRLERAAHRLTYTGLAVTAIALDAGYDSPEAFSRAFKSLFDMSPGKYREAALAGVLPAASGRGGPALCRACELIKEGKMVMEASIKELPALRVAYVRHVGPYEQCGRAWEAVCGWAAPKGLMGPQTRFIGLCHDDPEVTAADRIRYDACITLSGPAEPEGTVGVKEIGGGRYAAALHKGPLENLSATYAWLCGVWAAENGVELAGEPSLEFYLNDPERTPPAQLLTEIYVRLA